MDRQSSERKPFSLNIFHQILVATCLVALIPIGGLWYLGVHETQQELTTSVSRNLSASADSIAGSVEQWTGMNLRMLEQNAATPAIRSMEARSQDPVLKTLTDTYNWVYLAFTVLPDGQNLGRSDGREPTFYGDRVYFQQVMGGAPIGRQLVLGKSSNKPAYILAKPIKDQAEKTLGVIAIAMTLEDLSKTITNTRIGKTGYAILVDEGHRLIAHGDGSISSELQDFSRHPALAKRAGGDGVNRVHDESGKELVTYVKALNQGWKLIVQQDAEEAYARAEQALRGALALLLVTLVVVIIVALLLAKRLSAPIRRLTAAADEISRGNLEAVIGEGERIDEIGALSRAIERMRVSLQMAFERLRKR